MPERRHLDEVRNGAAQSPLPTTAATFPRPAQWILQLGTAF